MEAPVFQHRASGFLKGFPSHKDSPSHNRCCVTLTISRCWRSDMENRKQKRSEWDAGAAADISQYFCSRVQKLQGSRVAVDCEVSRRSPSSQGSFLNRSQWSLCIPSTHVSDFKPDNWGIRLFNCDACVHFLQAYMIRTAADIQSHYWLPLLNYFIFSCLFAIDKLLLGNCMKRQFCPALKTNHLKAPALCVVHFQSKLIFFPHSYLNTIS